MDSFDDSDTHSRVSDVQSMKSLLKASFAEKMQLKRELSSLKNEIEFRNSRMSEDNEFYNTSSLALSPSKFSVITSSTNHFDDFSRISRNKNLRKIRNVYVHLVFRWRIQSMRKYAFRKWALYIAKMRNKSRTIGSNKLLRRLLNENGVRLCRNVFCRWKQALNTAVKIQSRQYICIKKLLRMQYLFRPFCKWFRLFKRRRYAKSLLQHRNFHGDQADLRRAYLQWCSVSMIDRFARKYNNSRVYSALYAVVSALKCRLFSSIKRLFVQWKHSVHCIGETKTLKKFELLRRLCQYKNIRVLRVYFHKFYRNSAESTRVLCGKLHLLCGNMKSYWKCRKQKYFSRWKYISDMIYTYKTRYELGKKVKKVIVGLQRRQLQNAFRRLVMFASRDFTSQRQEEYHNLQLIYRQTELLSRRLKGSCFFLIKMFRKLFILQCVQRLFWKWKFNTRFISLYQITSCNVFVRFADKLMGLQNRQILKSRFAKWKNTFIVPSEVRETACKILFRLVCRHYRGELSLWKYPLRFLLQNGSSRANISRKNAFKLQKLQFAWRKWKSKVVISNCKTTTTVRLFALKRRTLLRYFFGKLKGKCFFEYSKQLAVYSGSNELILVERINRNRLYYVFSSWFAQASLRRRINSLKLNGYYMKFNLQCVRRHLCSWKLFVRRKKMVKYLRDMFVKIPLKMSLLKWKLWTRETMSDKYEKSSNSLQNLRNSSKVLAEDNLMLVSILENKKTVGAILQRKYQSLSINMLTAHRLKRIFQKWYTLYKLRLKRINKICVLWEKYRLSKCNSDLVGKSCFQVWRLNYLLSCNKNSLSNWRMRSIWSCWKLLILRRKSQAKLIWHCERKQFKFSKRAIFSSWKNITRKRLLIHANMLKCLNASKAVRISKAIPRYCTLDVVNPARCLEYHNDAQLDYLEAKKRPLALPFLPIARFQAIRPYFVKWFEICSKTKEIRSFAKQIEKQLLFQTFDGWQSWAVLVRKLKVAAKRIFAFAYRSSFVRTREVMMRCWRRWHRFISQRMQFLVHTSHGKAQAIVTRSQANSIGKSLRNWTRNCLSLCVRRAWNTWKGLCLKGKLKISKTTHILLQKSGKILYNLRISKAFLKWRFVITCYRLNEFRGASICASFNRIALSKNIREKSKSFGKLRENLSYYKGRELSFQLDRRFMGLLSSLSNNYESGNLFTSITNVLQHYSLHVADEVGSSFETPTASKRIDIAAISSAVQSEFNIAVELSLHDTLITYLSWLNKSIDLTIVCFNGPKVEQSYEMNESKSALIPKSISATERSYAELCAGDLRWRTVLIKLPSMKTKLRELYIPIVTHSDSCCFFHGVLHLSIDSVIDNFIEIVSISKEMVSRTYLEAYEVYGRLLSECIENGFVEDSIMLSDLCIQHNNLSLFTWKLVNAIFRIGSTLQVRYTPIAVGGSSLSKPTFYQTVFDLIMNNLEVLGKLKKKSEHFFELSTSNQSAAAVFEESLSEIKEKMREILVSRKELKEKYILESQVHLETMRSNDLLTKEVELLKNQLKNKEETLHSLQKNEERYKSELSQLLDIANNRL